MIQNRLRRTHTFDSQNFIMQSFCCAYIDREMLIIVLFIAAKRLLVQMKNHWSLDIGEQQFQLLNTCLKKKLILVYRKPTTSTYASCEEYFCIYVRQPTPSAQFKSKYSAKKCFVRDGISCFCGQW